ncbi:MAG: glycosyltransferase family 39 protein, partial [Burkholderiales bacterium]
MITLVAAVLRLHRLGALSLWMDEGFTAWAASMRWSEFVPMVTMREANMGAYFLFMRAWSWLGDSETMLRLPSALASIASVPVLFILARRMFDARVALVAAALVAVHSGLLVYAQEARGYSIFVLLILISWIFLLRVLERPSPANCAGYVLVSTLSVYMHFFGVLSLVAQGVGLVAGGDARTPWRRLAICAAAIAVLLLPIAGFVLFRDVGQIGWTARVRSHAGIRALAVMAGATLGNYRSVPGIATLAAYGAAVGLSAIALMRAASRRDQSYRMLSLAFAGAFVPLVVAMIVSVEKEIVIPRYLIECVPFAMILAAAGVCSLESNRRATVAAVALIALG